MEKSGDKDDHCWPSNTMYSQHPSLRKLEPFEKQYLIAVERGDVVRVTRILEMKNKNSAMLLDVNCKDPVGRSATLMAIDNENLDILELLLEHGVESRDALLHAINAEYVEAVDLLLEHEEIVHKENEPHSWEKVDRDISTFTAEITPLILAAHKDNYEILKILLDRGATLPMPHDVRCRCRDCVQAMEDDCLCHSRSRINAYRALSSPSLICLSSIDPILTAFELSWELRRLSMAENEFKEDYVKLRSRCQDFATALLDHARSSRELEMVLNYDPARPLYQHGEHMHLARLEMAIKYKQKKFIAHPNVQQLLSSLWYDGLPGFRRQNPLYQLWDIIKIGALFPFYSVMYMVCPNTEKSQLVRKPFFKFIIHSFSYLFFLFLLILASQRVETIVAEWFGNEEMQISSHEALRKQRGQPPTILETTILLYIIAHIWQETRELWTKGIVLYFHNLWNIIDFTRNSLYVGTAGMRILAYFQAQAEISDNPMAVFIPREAWNAYDPMLIADGLFAAGNVFAALKLVHIFSINPYLGPLQISLGRMVIDIIKFFFIYALVLFAFACGLNQLLWYYADMEKKQCFSGPGGTENWTQQRDSCLAWRRFSNLFESSQTLFWASFGLVDISNFELTGIKSYTRFWGLLMFGSYSVINVVVLLNLLIAMMSNSYNIISERADVEWKFARTTLFMNYFEEGSTVPPPFNIFPTFKHFLRLFGKKTSFRDMSFKKKETKMKERDTIYQSVMCNLVWRYVTAQQKETESHPVTEDNVNELRQDIYSFRHDLMRVLKGNGMNTKDIEKEKFDVSGKRLQIQKRRLIKDFQIGLMEVCTDEAAPEVASNKSMLARLVGLSGNENRSSQRWRDLIQAAKKSKIIGNRDSDSGRFGSIKKKNEQEQDQEIKKQDTMNPPKDRVESENYQTSESNLYPKLSPKDKPETENYQTSGSNLYPKIPEEDLTSSMQFTKTVTTQPISTGSPTLKARNMTESKPSINQPIQPIKSSLSQGVKLSPEALLRHSPQKAKDMKKQAPQPVEKVSQDQVCASVSKSPKFRPPPIIPREKSDLMQNKTNDNPSIKMKTSSERATCKDTSITVSTSPEKKQSKADPMMSVNMNQSTKEIGELIDFNENKDTERALNVTPGNISTFSGVKQKIQSSERKDNLLENVSSIASPMPSSQNPLTSVAQTNPNLIASSMQSNQSPIRSVPQTNQNLITSTTQSNQSPIRSVSQTNQNLVASTMQSNQSPIRSVSQTNQNPITTVTQANQNPVASTTQANQNSSQTTLDNQSNVIEPNKSKHPIAPLFESKGWL
ncbi:transient-receptor-potential-like protein [Parasteatoda tepidariorum]|uniref:transient-receptor-potential-like protein n=1 Tax=Parasteatoda tepidariorum TaxID=114398 RepID=UPI001C728054|nr:transient-receptor-potential-like protein [Parasteatoda tepidariorum]